MFSILLSNSFILILNLLMGQIIALIERVRSPVDTVNILEKHRLNDWETASDS